MVYATCLNDSCGKDEWWLKKPPAEYAGGGPKCPECGTTRVEVGGGSDEQPAGAQQPDTAQAKPAKPAGSAQGDQGGTGIATQEDAVSTGAQVGEMVASLSADSPEEQAETQGMLMTALGSAAASLGQSITQQRKEAMERSKQASQADLKAVDDYVSCPDCGTQITDLPAAGTQFRCPRCEQLLEAQ